MKKNEDAQNFWIDPSDQDLFPTKKTKNQNYGKEDQSEDVGNESYRYCDEIKERMRK